MKVSPDIEYIKISRQVNDIWVWNLLILHKNHYINIGFDYYDRWYPDNTNLTEFNRKMVAVHISNFFKKRHHERQQNQPTS